MAKNPNDKITTLTKDNESEVKFQNTIRPASDSKVVNPVVNSAQLTTTNMRVKTWTQEELLNNNSLGLIVLDTLERYEKIMKPKIPINSMIGGQQQTTLYQLLVRITQSKTDFTKNWELVLAQFNKNPNNVYAMNYVARFLDKMNVTKNDIELFKRLLNLIIVTCNPETRAENMRKVSLEKTLKGVTSDAIRINLNNFYRQYVS